MALRFEDGWYVGDAADDLAEVLLINGADGYPVNEVRHSICSGCGAAVFEVHGVWEERVRKRICRSCGDQHYLLDSEDYWDDDSAYISVCTCEEELFNVAVGYSMYADEVGGIRSVAFVERCTACGRIGSPVEWMLRTGDMGMLDRA
ncbi:hypothetical protein ACQP1P_33110 [Dactylosporangium sp. CA-052675]|uniref:hypothetical protein n=1 Tax=Dactylosporangium sp. CA-052675 TaxID=3239927 RepID=UPI003D94A13E